MLMDCFVHSGQLPHNLRALAESSEWCCRLQPKFIPEDPDHFRRPILIGDASAETRSTTMSIDQTRLFIGVPSGGAERLYGVCRVNTHCWRTQCGKLGLKWVLESQTWFGLLCEVCWTISWEPNQNLSRLLRDYLNKLPNLARWVMRQPGWSEDPLKGIEIPSDEPFLPDDVPVSEVVPLPQGGLPEIV